MRVVANEGGRISILDMVLAPIAMPLALVFPNSVDSVGIGVWVLEVLIGGGLSVAVVRLLRKEKAPLKYAVVVVVAALFSFIALLTPFEH